MRNHRKGILPEIAILAVIVVFCFVGYAGYNYITTLQYNEAVKGAGLFSAQPDGTTTNTVLVVGSDTTNLFVRNKNPNSVSNSFVAANITYTDSSNKVLGNITTTTSTSGTFASLTGALKTNSIYNYYILSDPETVSASLMRQVATSGIAYADMSAANNSAIEMQAWSTSYTNLTAGGSSATSNYSMDFNTTAATAMGSGGSADYIIRYQTNLTSAQFGADEPSTIICDDGMPFADYTCADFDTSKFSKTDGVIEIGMTAKAGWSRLSKLPKYCSDNGYDIGWQMPVLKSSDGAQDAKIHLAASLGDPTTGAKIVFVDSAYYLGTDGKIKCGTSDDSGTDIGATNRYFKIEVT